MFEDSPSNPDDLREDNIIDEVVSRVGDLWQLGDLRLLCGNALDADAHNIVLAGAQYRMCITDPPYNPRLVALLAKAQRWFTSLSSGRSDSVLSIAQEYGLASKDVTRVLYLAFRAPDLVEKFVRGEQPIDLGVKRLLAMAPLPMDWAEQRRVLGFEH